jgi:hypothetical protein
LEIAEAARDLTLFNKVVDRKLRVFDLEDTLAISESVEI